MGSEDKKKKRDLLCPRNVWIAIGLQGLSLAMLLGLIVCLADWSVPSARRMFHFGPTGNGVDVSVFGIDVNSWGKWGLLVGWIVVNECLATWSYKIYKNWYRNRLLDPKSPTTGVSDPAALVMVNLFSVITFVPRIFNYLLVIVTGMVQFLVPGFLARRVVSTIVDARYLRDKKEARREGITESRPVGSSGSSRDRLLPTSRRQ